MKNIYILSFLIISTFARSQFYETFGNAQAVSSFNSPACDDMDSCFILTNNSNFQQGAVWDLQAIDLSIPFDAKFCMFLGDNDDGADGFAFVLRAPGSNQYGNSGGGLGYGNQNGSGGISPSVAIEFDSYYNPDYFDIPADHTQLILNGAVNLPPAVAAIPLSPTSANIEDNNFHITRVVWDPISQNLSMYFDDVLRFTYNQDIINSVFNGNSNVLWGFTASTGGQTSLHQICFPTLSIPIEDHTICASDSVELSYYHENLSSYTWRKLPSQTIISWDNTMGFPLTDTSFYASEPGFYQVEVEYNNHTYSKTIEITTVLPPENQEINICTLPIPINLYDSLSNALNDGSWSGPSVLTNGFLGTFTPNSSIFGTYRYTSPSLAVCPINFYEVLIQEKQAFLNINANLVPCTSTEYVLESNPFSNEISNFSYNWLNAQNQVVSTSDSFNYTINNNEQVRVVISDATNSSCFFDTLINLTFVSLQSLDLGPDLSLCVNETTSITLNQSWESITWHDDSNNTSINTNTDTIIWCEVQSSDNCIFRDSIIITYLPKPTFELIKQDTIGCNPLQSIFQIQSENNINFIRWEFSDGQQFNSNLNINPTFNNIGVFDLNLILGGTNLCNDTVFYNDIIEVFSSPVANFTIDVLELSNEYEVELTNTSINGTSYNWKIPFLSIDSFVTNLFPLSFTETIEDLTVELIVNNTNCSDSITKTVVFPKKIIFYVPNSFTPDANELNNTFQPIITEGINLSTYKLEIYNRWGELIFTSFDSHVGWDGTYANKLVQEGIYMWKITCKSEKENIGINETGFVNLMK